MSRARAKVHLVLYDETRTLAIDHPIGPTRLTRIVEPVRELSHAITARAIEHASGQGRTVACTKGCGACCRQVVPVAPVEARRLADLVAAMPAKRRDAVRARFDRALARLEAEGLIEPATVKGRQRLVAKTVGDERAQWLEVSRRYFSLGIACPFLEREACSIHDERPIVCREHVVTSPPDRCATLSEDVQTIDRPVPLNEALTELTNSQLDRDDAQIPLVLALGWARAHGHVFDEHRDGQALYIDLIGLLQKKADHSG